MSTWVALLRGINVGGNNSLPMKELVAMLESIGVRRVKTYVQSREFGVRVTTRTTRVGVRVRGEFGGVVTL
ncbi:DUF1697 domain-containing protein, partial [Sedimenticola hydrogenitrophicus]|uniref:DUF1697 domain-containing protein n=1 Tax=Sedimenticola hydrogenitrophicus TaxID=2967975 RepID=UPI0021A2F88F